MALIYPEFYERLFRHFGPQHWWPGDSKLEIVLGAILTQNTAWSNVEKALKNIKDAGSISLGFLRETDLNMLAQLIRPTGYFNQKAARVKGFIEYLDENYHGHLEEMLSLHLQDLRTALLSIKGIGPETADDIILYAAEKPVFVIDSYTKRVMSRHSICSQNVGYEELQTIIETQVPKNVPIYKEFHGLIVILAKNYCHKKNPDCRNCPLGEFDRIQGFGDVD